MKREVDERVGAWRVWGRVTGGLVNAGRVLKRVWKWRSWAFLAALAKLGGHVDSRTEARLTVLTSPCAAQAAGRYSVAT